MTVVVTNGSTMSLGDPNPSPEREPKKSGPTPRRPELLVRELDPISTQIQLHNTDRLTDVLALCGLPLNDAAITYLWKMLRNNNLVNMESFHDSQGALGLSMEIDIATKHELECRGDPEPERRDYEERVSVTLSSRHREGSEIAALGNLNEGHPALDGLFVELVATPIGDTPALANIYWDQKGLAQTDANTRWDLIRGFNLHFKNTEIAEALPLTPGQREVFHYLTVDLDPMTIKVQRLPHDPNISAIQEANRSNQKHANTEVEFRFKLPSPAVLELVLSLTGALQLQGDWVTKDSKRVILSHLMETLVSLKKLDIDTLMMCENAQPCLVFSREELCDGATYPPKLSSKVGMVDYTCGGGELRLELQTGPDQVGTIVRLNWDIEHARLTDVDWAMVKKALQPYLIGS